tara:strand:+ start:660 stop:1592 length:933 start_codon:yes stop_codon:yes gene_type:complete
MYKDINSVDSFFDKEDDANFFKGLPRKPENFEKVESFTDRFGQTYQAGIIDNIAFKLDDEFQKEVVEQAESVDQETERTKTRKAVDLVKDTGQGIATGIEKGVRQMNQAALSVAGLPADFANFTIKTLTGDKDFKGPIPNTEDLKQSFEKITNWASKYLPDVSTDNIKRNYRNETYGNIIEGISQFTAGAVPAAKAVGVTKTLYGTFAPSPILRAMAWGAIADATTLMPQDSLQNIIAESLKSIPKEERGNVSNIVVSALQVNPKNAELVERIRGSTSGALVGAAIDKFIIPLAKSIIKVAKEAPWEELD